MADGAVPILREKDQVVGRGIERDLYSLLGEVLSQTIALGSHLL